MSIVLTLGDAADNEVDVTQNGHSTSPRAISGSSGKPRDVSPAKSSSSHANTSEKSTSTTEASSTAQGTAKKSSHAFPIPPSRPNKPRTTSNPASPSSPPASTTDVTATTPPTASSNIDTPAAAPQRLSLNSTKFDPESSLITLPGTPPPGSEDLIPAEFISSSRPPSEIRERSQTVAAPSRLSTSSTGAESATSEGSKRASSTISNPNGRVLPSRPGGTLRRPNRPGAQTARGNLFTAFKAEEEAASKDESQHVHFEEPQFKSKEFEDVLSSKSSKAISQPSSPRSPDSTDSLERVPSIYDPKNPFGIEDMAQKVDSPKATHTLKARPPAPPVITEPPPRPARTGSAPFSSKHQRVIPKPPSTTPPAVAPLVVPRIPVAIEGHHHLGHGHHIEEADKKAKKERKETHRPPVPPKNGLSSSQLSVSNSTITPSSSASSISASEPITDTEASASESAPAAGVVPVLAPNPVFELHPEQRPISPRSHLSKSTEATHSKKVNSNQSSLSNSTAVASPSLEKKDKHDKADKHDKEKKEKEKEKEKEKDKAEKKDKEKEDKKAGILSILSSKLTLRGKKHDKHEFEAVEEEESESDSIGGPIDPLLAPQLSPAVTPREGLMYNPNHPANAFGNPQSATSSQLSEKDEDLELALSHLPASSPISPRTMNTKPEDAAHITPQASTETPSDINEIETHKNVLLAQIRNMEDLHRRLREAITEEQIALSSARKHGRSRSRSSGSASTSHTPISPSLTRKKDKAKDKETSHATKDSPKDAAGPLMSPRTKPTSPITSARTPTPVTANTRQKFPSVAGLKIPEGDAATVLGFKQKLGRSETRGDVYACRHLKSGQLIAVRVIPLNDETQYEDIRTRSKTILSLENERLATVMHVQVVSGELWIVSQYCPIGSVLTMLETNSLTLGEDAIRVIARSILVALSFLHRSKLTHGSLTLSKVLVDSYADVKLCDYSLHSILGEETSKASFESQCRADLHALAVILVQMAEWELYDPDSEATASPQLVNPTKFSNDFVDFIQACAYADQPAVGLLGHPFLSAHVSTQPLVDSVASALASLRSHSAPDAGTHPAVTRQELDEKYMSKALSPSISKIRLHERNESSNSDSGDAQTGESSAAVSMQKLTNLKSKIDESIEKTLVGASDETQRLVQQLRAIIFEAADEILAPGHR